MPQKQACLCAELALRVVGHEVCCAAQVAEVQHGLAVIHKPLLLALGGVRAARVVCGHHGGLEGSRGVYRWRHVQTFQ